jgi:hypothetical protein
MMVSLRNEGPNAFIVVLPNGLGNMGKQLAVNVRFHALVSLFVGYLAAATLAPGTEYLRVFQVTGTAAFLAYGFAWGHRMSWFGRPGCEPPSPFGLLRTRLVPIGPR